MYIAMKKIIYFLGKYWLFVLLAAIAATLLTIRFIKKPAPSLPVPSPTPIFGPLPQPKFGFGEILGQGPSYKISLSESDFGKIPKTLSVYKVKKLSKEEILSRFNDVISGLGFIKPPIEEQRKDGFFLVFREADNYLKIKVGSGQFSFAGKVSLAQGQELTPPQIQSLIEEVFVSWNLIPSGSKAKKLEGFVPTGMELSPISDVNKAVFFRVFFDLSFNSLPIVGVGPAENHIEATIDNKGVLVSLFFNLHQVDKEIVDSYPSKSFEETIKELGEGKAQIIQVLTQKSEDRSIPPPNQIKEVQISSLSLAYYETVETQDFYQPVFLLKGKISLKSGENFQASFILPAIESKYLSP